MAAIARSVLPSAAKEDDLGAFDLTCRDNCSQPTQWSTRTMAAETGLSEATVRRIWHPHGLKPHSVESEKLEDIVGLYLNPPEHAIVMV